MRHFKEDGGGGRYRRPFRRGCVRSVNRRDKSSDCLRSSSKEPSSIPALIVAAAFVAVVVDAAATVAIHRIGVVGLFPVVYAAALPTRPMSMSMSMSTTATKMHKSNKTQAMTKISSLKARKTKKPSHPSLRTQDATTENYIISGSTVDSRHEYPYMVWGEGGCGGSLVHEDIVLTGASFRSLGDFYEIVYIFVMSAHSFFFPRHFFVLCGFPLGFLLISRTLSTKFSKNGDSRSVQVRPTLGLRGANSCLFYEGTSSISLEPSR